MPYYRILIWTKRKKQPFTGIRYWGDANINAVYKEVRDIAYTTYRDALIDIEVQMLSKLCTAVKEHLKKPEAPEKLNRL